MMALLTIRVKLKSLLKIENHWNNKKVNYKLNLMIHKNKQIIYNISYKVVKQQNYRSVLKNWCLNTNLQPMIL